MEHQSNHVPDPLLDLLQNRSQPPPKGLPPLGIPVLILLPPSIRQTPRGSQHGPDNPLPRNPRRPLRRTHPLSRHIRIPPPRRPSQLNQEENRQGHEDHPNLRQPEIHLFERPKAFVSPLLCFLMDQSNTASQSGTSPNTLPNSPGQPPTHPTPMSKPSESTPTTTLLPTTQLNQPPAPPPYSSAPSR